MQKSNFKILFHFANADVDVIEIKRTGIATEDKSKLYYWFLYDRVNDMIDSLGFRSMDTKGNLNIRVFDEGNFEFDTVRGTFKADNETIELKCLPESQPLDQVLKEAIGDYLTMLNLRTKI